MPNISILVTTITDFVYIFEALFRPLLSFISSERCPARTPMSSGVLGRMLMSVWHWSPAAAFGVPLLVRVRAFLRSAAAMSPRPQTGRRISPGQLSGFLHSFRAGRSPAARTPPSPSHRPERTGRAPTASHLFRQRHEME